ncbi:MAG: apolipoprotein N-acyltransferase, partial [Candidatus Omnitrophica bacterium]|nr:apolipoprotein N-acyltransferase [Candidatus Omnitrophota bacterium]
LVMAAAYASYTEKSFSVWSSPKISVLQGNIPQNQKWDEKYSGEIISIYGKLTEEASREGADLIVWPETAYPYLVVSPEEEPKEVKDDAKKYGIPILAGAVCAVGENYYNSAILYDKEGKVVSIYNKTHLVPFGEYIPCGKYLDCLRNYIDKPIGSFTRGSELKLFSLNTSSDTAKNPDVIIRKTNFNKFGVLICFEDIFPYLTREFVGRGANFMINITNDAWFGETAASRQHLQASVFRAVENRIPVIRAANTGVSCFIDPSGRITSSVEQGGKEIFVRGISTANINIIKQKARYTLYGDVFVQFSLIMLIVIGVTGTLLRKIRRGY